LYFSGNNLIEHYFERIKKRTANPVKVILASDALRISAHLLDLFATSTNSDKLNLYTVSHFSDRSKQVELRQYFDARMAGELNGSADVTKMIEKFNLECERQHNENCDIPGDYMSNMVEAVLTYAAAFKLSYQQLCPDADGICDQIKHTQTVYSTINDVIRNRLSKSKLDGGYIGDSSGLIYTLNQVNNNSTYDVVGYFSNSNSWELSSQFLRSNQIKSRCTEKSTCGFKCFPKDPQYIFEKHNSPYIIAFSHKLDYQLEDHHCGDQVTNTGFLRMEAFYYIVNKMRNITGIDFSTLFIETCNPHFRIQSIMSKLFKNENMMSLVDTQGKKHELPVRNIAVYIGDGSADGSMLIQSYLKPHKIIQISQSGTSDWVRHSPQFPMFLKTAPSTQYDAIVIIDILIKNGWDTIGLLYTESAYGEDSKESILRYAQKKGICVSYIKNLGLTKSSGVTVARDIKNKLNDDELKHCLPKPFVIIAEHQMLRLILQELSLYTPWKQNGHFFVGGASWGSMQEIINGVEDGVIGSLTVTYVNNYINLDSKGINDFQDYVELQNPKNNAKNYYFIKFWQNHFECFLPHQQNPQQKFCDPSLSLKDTNYHFSSQPQKVLNFKDDQVVKNILLAGLLFANGYRVAKAKQCFTPTDIECSQLFHTSSGRKILFDEIKAAKIPSTMTGVYNTIQPFNESGELPPDYTVYTITRKENITKYETLYDIKDNTIYPLKPSLVHSAQNKGTNKCGIKPVCAKIIDGKHPEDVLNTSVKQVSLPTTHSWLLPILVTLLVLLTTLTVLSLLIAHKRKWFQNKKDCNIKNTPDKISNSF